MREACALPGAFGRRAESQGRGREDIIPIGGYPCVPPQGAKSEKRQPEGCPHSPLEAAQTSSAVQVRGTPKGSERSGCPPPRWRPRLLSLSGYSAP